MLTLNNPRAPFLPLWSICNFVFCDSSGLFGNFQTLAVISRINLGLRGSARPTALRLFSAAATNPAYQPQFLNTSDSSILLEQVHKYQTHKSTNAKHTQTSGRYYGGNEPFAQTQALKLYFQTLEGTAFLFTFFLLIFKIFFGALNNLAVSNYTSAIPFFECTTFCFLSFWKTMLQLH